MDSRFETKAHTKILIMASRDGTIARMVYSGAAWSSHMHESTSRWEKYDSASCLAFQWMDSCMNCTFNIATFIMNRKGSGRCSGQQSLQVLPARHKRHQLYWGICRGSGQGAWLANWFTGEKCLPACMTLLAWPCNCHGFRLSHHTEGIQHYIELFYNLLSILTQLKTIHSKTGNKVCSCEHI